MADSLNKLRQFYKAQEDPDIQKISPAAAGLAGWWLGGTIRDDFAGASKPTAAQQREFERQIEESMRPKGKKVRKESAMEKMQAFFQKDTTGKYVQKVSTENSNQPTSVEENDIIEKVLSLPPFAGARLDPTSHRWVKPENVGQTYSVRRGKKRLRGSGTGGSERSVSGHGKGRIREEGAGRKNKTATDLAASRRKKGKI